MFEIRIICDPADTEPIVAALDRTFTTGTVSVYPSRDRKRNRLYARAEYEPADAEPTAPWPTPEEAYANAPSINSEIGWVARTLAAAECFTELGRDFYLRKAALLDRIALLDEPHDLFSDATETADAAAVFLMDMDQPGPFHDPRTYVRQQYAHWLSAEQ
ncbi:hypothetical protein [Streptomyces aurantiogriseus]|uniref:Uncharacterized protein n=1 Tax=Streptomyces aurantiogriseus TaxID=66870 RepID=A0A918FKV2_9ACTN|nr:hypothetical protein [Streptomyces aurantiogriseus]GGR48482.1 hypothetical protein GCM10010251_76810 [Streptomyces aurantiogriseus]